MKAILMSIKPKYVSMILNGEKTIEIRTKFPKDYVGWVYIYCTKNGEIFKNSDNHYSAYKNRSKCIYKGRLSNGAVVARFWCDKVEEIICRPFWGWGEWECYTKSLGYSEISQASCLKNREIVSYLKGKKGTAIHINDLEIFDKPMEIKDLVRPCQEPIDYCGESCLECPYAVFQQYSDYDESLPHGDMKKVERCLLITKLKAPRSWYYVEV